ncbi:unconventional myosin-IXAb [Sinocyclocheilus anshuiensis]|uniref:unconventional myosin-IXAb n=1 Tax=Sinocyclocheilus anshuiensis TaxID=1608454 RepID=UPI0007BAA21E|nr:PREDICTED: unconventional myosin-IXa-like [Sinocyclocheilus anshuiensis]
MTARASLLALNDNGSLQADLRAKPQLISAFADGAAPGKCRATEASVSSDKTRRWDVVNLSGDSGANGSCCSIMSCHDAGGRRRYEDSEFTLRVYPGALSEGTIYCPVSARKVTSAAEVIERVIERLQLDRARLYVLAEVKEFGGEEWILNPCDCPVQRMMLWPRMALENRLAGEDYRFLLREKDLDGSIRYGNLQMWLRVTEGRRRMVERGLLPQPPYVDDLCALPDLNERTLLENLRGRFRQEKIYTYVGGILIVVNPFKFLPIYNPKYVKMYDKQRLGKLEPHIYAVADVAYHAMLQRRRNQCIVISGESGSGKTQSTNFLIHHLTALSQKGFASGVEQIILGAGPVLEAFGNAKTAHNNNSSRFGKFIQVNYQESGTVRGAYVEKYLLEKSRLVYQEHNERNYHVFYYLLAGASEEERKAFHLLKPEEYHYLNQDCFTVEGEDLKHDFERLQLAMEMVGFLPTTRKQIFSLLSAILLLGNIRYKKKTYRDDSIDICNPEVLPIISELLEVKEEMLFEALTTRKTVTVGERLIVPYKLAEVRCRGGFCEVCGLKCQILSIGVLDIFGFEDYENNSFEQFCINFANETLQHYFNQHVFKLEQEEYRSEGISWHMIDYIDNTACINLISKKPTALLHLLDEECNFPQASNQTLLDKFKRQHEGNGYIEFPAVMEPAFIIRHYAGKVKYSVKDFREKNTDHMRPDIVALLKSSRNAFICGLMGIDPVATFRWAVIRAYFRALVAFREAGKRHKEKMTTTSGEKQCHYKPDPVMQLNGPVQNQKSVDSFSFLHHPVHQRSLEILQRCKDDKYNSSISRRSPRTPLSDLQGTNTRRENMSRRCERVSSHQEEGIFVNSVNNKLLERAQGILMRNKNCKTKPSLPKHLLDVRSLKYLSGLTLHDRITKSLLHLHKKKKPPSISAQFNVSLNKLMETLGQSEPYFVKCIRSNAEKLPLRFSDVLVLRQLRYSGMLETVRIRRSGYSVKYSFQDFAHHFRVLLPAGFHTSQTGIRQFLQGVDLEPNGHQVGRSTVFLRERLRQRLQEQLHQEVLRRIVCLQRSFRTQQERRRFCRQRRAAQLIQRWWGACLTRADADLQQGAALRLQAAWRGFRERRLFLRRRRAALIIQTRWRRVLQTRHSAARLIQSVWRSLRQRHSFLQQRRAAVTLQAACRGQRERHRCRILREQRRGEKSLCENTVSKSLHAQQNPPEVQEEKGETQSAEPLRSVDDSTLKSRSKRQSRRQRELQQATFSLELLKVRSASVDDALPAQSPLSRHLPSESQGSFELLGCPDEEPTAPEPKPMEENQSSLASFKPHFYIADEDSSPLKQAREKKESVVVIIRMQKEMPVDQSSLEALQKHETMDAEEIHRETDDRSNGSSSPDPPEPQTIAPCSSKPLQLDSRDSVREVASEPKKEVQKKFVAQSISISMKEKAFSPKRSRLTFSKSDKDLVNQERSQAIQREAGFRSLKNREKEQKRIQKTMSSGDLGKMDLLRKSISQTDGRVRGKMRFWSKSKHGDKKMSTRECSADSELNDRRNDSPLGSPEQAGLSERGRDSKENREPMMGMMSMKRRRSVKISSVSLESSAWQNDSLHILTSTADYRSMNDFLMKKCMKIWSFIQTTFPNRVRGKMRFWSKSKRDDKKMSTRGRSADSELTDSPLGSPEQAGLSERGHDSKENREPMMSMMSMKRRRSVKISSVSLESSAWQNDSLHILTSTADYRSMNDFLMKKISDLEAEDSQKDTPVDVVFKKALKEFRLNIFNSYSTALAMDDGRSIRYKDLYALFEHILEKNMRLEQRDWSESPVKVWVNTFKVFLDEFMTEYKPMNGTITKAPKPERKKRRKKESDTVEEHMGHIFKSTQYSIPTYCEFCSSLIWIMDKACVCKLCRYACHRKCCLRMTTTCSKKFDPELSSRQFGVELSRLTSDERAVPLVVEKLINYIEMHGLYTEGIYRKSGSTNKIKELKQGLDTDANSVNLDDYNIHVIASVLKQWLRDLPNPLMTFELYEEFLRAMGLQDKSEVVQGVYSVIDQLSRTHLSTLERLIFHLVRISFQEETNRMSANALAIVFAPCILRCPDTTDPLQSVRDIGKTTACVELVICEQMRKYKARLKDINTLEFAENKAKSRLTHIRRSLGKARLRKSGRHTPSPPLSPRAEREEPGEEGAEPGLSEQQQAAMQQEENVLTQQIENLQKEKEELTYEMLALDPRASDDEMLESEASIGTADSSENLMESEGAASDQWEKSPGASSATRWRKSESKSRRGLRRQPESLDSVDSVSSTPHYRFRSSSSGPLFSAASPGDLHILPDQEGSAQASLTTRCASSSEKTHPRPRGNRSCPPKPREPGEGGSGGSRRREHDFSSSQPLVLYGSNEFMV